MQCCLGGFQGGEVVNWQTCSPSQSPDIFYSVGRGLRLYFVSLNQYKKYKKGGVVSHKCMHTPQVQTHGFPHGYTSGGHGACLSYLLGPPPEAPGLLQWWCPWHVTVPVRWVLIFLSKLEEEMLKRTPEFSLLLAISPTNLTYCSL